MEYKPITTEEAIDAILNGERLVGREIPDLYALIEGFQERISDPDTAHLECENCLILECQCQNIEISVNVIFFKSTFMKDTNFSGASFKKRADFALVKFTKRVDFNTATFMEAAVFNDVEFQRDAIFRRATFRSARTSFERAVFTEDANFEGTKFMENADFDAAEFTKRVTFAEATFTGHASFIGTRFQGDAEFSGATFTNNAAFDAAMFMNETNFRSAVFKKDFVVTGNFAGGDFTHTNFNKCFLIDRDGYMRLDLPNDVADLEGANLEHTKGLILDSTPIRNAKFSPRASDPWSQLRRAYTGPRLVFTLLFLVAFFTPYVLKTFVWVSVNRVQEELKQHIEDIRDRVEALESKEHPAAGPLAVALEAVADRLPQDNDVRWQTKSVWKLVLGMDKKWWYWVTAIALLLYNLVRAVLTWFVAPMRDAEERSGVSPAYRRDMSNPPKKGDRWEVATWPLRWMAWWLGTWTDAYGWMIWPHWFAQVGLYLAVISFCVHAVYWLRLPVTIPAVVG